MPYQPIYRYALLPDQDCSAYSRPRRDHEDGSYEIHIPADFEVWLIYYNTIAQRPRKPRHPPAPAPSCRTGLLACPRSFSSAPTALAVGFNRSGMYPTANAAG